MGYDPPGLEYEPDDAALVGYRSLMPQKDKPGVVGRMLRLPLELLALPFKLVAALLRAPLRMLGIGRRRDGDEHGAR